MTCRDHAWSRWQSEPLVVSLDGRRWETRYCAVCAFVEYRPAPRPADVVTATWHEDRDMGDEQRGGEAGEP